MIIIVIIDTGAEMSILCESPEQPRAYRLDTPLEQSNATSVISTSQTDG